MGFEPTTSCIRARLRPLDTSLSSVIVGRDMRLRRDEMVTPSTAKFFATGWIVNLSGDWWHYGRGPGLPLSSIATTSLKIVFAVVMNGSPLCNNNSDFPFKFMTLKESLLSMITSTSWPMTDWTIRIFLDCKKSLRIFRLFLKKAHL